MFLPKVLQNFLLSYIMKKNATFEDFTSNENIKRKRTTHHYLKSINHNFGKKEREKKTKTLDEEEKLTRWKEL